MNISTETLYALEEIYSRSHGNPTVYDFVKWVEQYLETKEVYDES